jgi:hypothetical protein
MEERMTKPAKDGNAVSKKIQQAVRQERERCIRYVESCRKQFRKLARLGIRQDIEVAAGAIAEGLKKI